jgi:predicted ATPase
MTLEKKAEEGQTVFKTNPIVSVADPATFNDRILRARISQFTSVSDALEEKVFFDRGIPDVLAYMDCFGQRYGSAFEKASNDHRYDTIFIMPPWKEIHISDNERFESYEESMQVHECLFDCYTRFGYDVHLVPKMDVIKRADFILDHLNGTS